MWESAAGRRTYVGSFGPFGSLGLFPVPQTTQALSAEGRRYGRSPDTIGQANVTEQDNRGPWEDTVATEPPRRKSGAAPHQA